MGNHIDAQEKSSSRRISTDKKGNPQNKPLDLSTNSAINNGGSTDYYRIDKSWSMVQDIIEDRELNYAQGNILKVAFTMNTGRHEGTTYERELNKIIYFAQRELDRQKGN